MAIKILADMIAVRIGIANALGFIITRYKKKNLNLKKEVGIAIKSKKTSS